MKGHLRERSPSHWAIILDTQDATTGKRKRRWHSYAGTKRQAQVECARLLSEMKGGFTIEPNRTTLVAFLDKWLDHIRSQVSPRTHERYAEITHKNIVPLFGGIMLAKLSPMHVSDAYSKALSTGPRNGKGGLSPRTVHHLHRV